MKMDSNMRIRKSLTEQYLKELIEASNDIYVKAAAEEYLSDEAWFFAGIPKSNIEDLRRAIKYNVNGRSEGIRFQNSEIIKTLVGKISFDGSRVSYIRNLDLNPDEYIQINLEVGEGTESTRIKELMRSPDVIAFLNELTRPN